MKKVHALFLPDVQLLSLYLAYISHARLLRGPCRSGRVRTVVLSERSLDESGLRFEDGLGRQGDHRALPHCSFHPVRQLRKTGRGGSAVLWHACASFLAFVCSRSSLRFIGSIVALQVDNVLAAGADVVHFDVMGKLAS
jgi:hypothetical protein